MTPNRQDIEPLLTVEHVRAKRRAILTDERLLEEIEQRLETNREELDAMLRFVPEQIRVDILAETYDNITSNQDLFDATAQVNEGSAATAKKGAVGKRIAAEKPVTKRELGRAFSSALIALVKTAPSGITHRDLMEKLQHGKYSDRLQDGAKAYYRTATRLFNKGGLIRHGGLIYHPQVFVTLQKTGKLPVIEEGVSVRPGGAASIVVEVLQKNPNGLSAPELKAQVGSHPEAPKSVAGHGQYIYNVLATLMGSGKVNRVDGIYSLTEKATPRSSGASGTHASGPAR